MLDTNFDVKQVLQKRLASSLGLDKYKFIMETVKNTDVSTDDVFQTTFNAFYIVRRNAEWRNKFYTYFQSIKDTTPTFEDIITYLYENTGNIEPSFSSKLLATLDPRKPIWDRYVVEKLKLKLKGKTQEEKLQNVIQLYSKMEEWYVNFLKTEKATECIRVFDETLPEYIWISSIKKIDAILWSIR